MNEININGEIYVKKSEIKQKAEEVNGMQYVLVRGKSSGVFCGYLKEKEGREVTLCNVRRIWYWDGAASISEIALYGVSKPENCKFTVENNSIKILDAIEILEVTQEAMENIKNVPVWKMK